MTAFVRRLSLAGGASIAMVTAAVVIVSGTPRAHVAPSAVALVPCERNPTCFTPLPIVRRLRCRVILARGRGGPCECFPRCAGHARMLGRLRRLELASPGRRWFVLGSDGEARATPHPLASAAR